jgi:glycosyltransferase involved in cell wall biosynthesis
MQNHQTLKVMILSMEYSPEISGGVGTHVQELSAGLSRNGDRVAVVACTVGKQEKIIERNRIVYLIPPSQPAGSSMAASSMTQGILAFNKDLVSFAQQTVFAEGETPDVIQCYNWLTFPAAYELGQNLHIPVVSTIQFVSQPCERWWGQIPDPEIMEQEATAFRDADRLITVSHSMRSIVQRTHGISDHKIHVVYNAMDVEAFGKINIAPSHLTKLRAAVASGNEKIVFFAGRLNPQKGVSAIFESIPQVLEHYPNVKYVFAGEPDSQHFSRAIREMFDQNPVLKSKTLMLGKLPRHKLAALYKIADVALVPSVYEPFGYAAIEAMAAGVPLIATAAGGLAEIVDHEKTGLSVPVHAEGNGVRAVDVPSLASATRRMLQDEDFARQMALAAGEKVKKIFGLETMVRDTRAIYEAAISEFQPQYA